MPINWGAIIKTAAENIGPIAQVAGNAAAGRGAGRAQEAVTQQAQDRGALERYATEQATAQRALEAIDAGRLSRAAGKMSEAELALNAPGQRASNAVRGDLLARGTRVAPTHPRANVVDFGGFSLGDLSPESRQLGQAMSREALTSQLAGSPTPYSQLPDADYSRTLQSKAPGMTALPEENALDKILAAIGTYGSLTAALPQPRQRTTGAAIPVNPRIASNVRF